MRFSSFHGFVKARVGDKGNELCSRGGDDTEHVA